MSKWICLLQDLKEIWFQNSIGGGPDRAAQVRTMLIDGALNQFDGSLEEGQVPSLGGGGCK